MADAADSTSASSGQFALTVADLNTTVNHEPRISHRRLAKALGYTDDRKLLHLARRHRAALERFGEVSATVAETSKLGGRPGKVEWYNKRQVLYLCAKSEMENGTEVTIQMVEVFDAHLAAHAAPPRSEPTAGPSPLSFLPGAERLVSSLHVAQALRRRHTGILRLLDVLAAERPELLDRHLRFATYLHDNGRPYRCFHMDRTGFAALMARIPSSDGRAEALRDATLHAWPADSLPPPPFAPPAAIADGHAMMRIGGETLIVDMRNFAPAKSERAVLFTIDGGMRVDRAVCYNPNRACEGRRLGYGLTPMPTRPGRDYFELGWIIGTVIEPTVAKEAGGRGTTAEPRVPGAGRPVRSMLPDLAAAVVLGAA